MSSTAIQTVTLTSEAPSTRGAVPAFNLTELAERPVWLNVFAMEAQAQWMASPALGLRSVDFDAAYLANVRGYVRALNS